MGLVNRKLKAMLEVSALAWLRYEKRCPIVSLERWPLSDWVHGRPDVCGVTEYGKVIQVEIKMTWGDYRNDAKKPKNLEWKTDKNGPWKSYYLAPIGLADRIKDDRPKGWGVLKPSIRKSMYAEQFDLFAIRACKGQEASRQLSAGDMVAACAHQAGTVCALGRKVVRLME